jgi:pyruvate formate lyase activating enzyme
VQRDAGRCSFCLQCVELCPALVHEPVGYRVSVEDLVTEIEKDSAFFDQSGGGVTFSGGEPLAQPEFLMEILEVCGHLCIHRTVDTSAYVSLETLMRVAAHTDLFLCDLKHMNSDSHREITGVSNELILENIRLLRSEGQHIRIRMPLIPGMNDSKDNLLKCIDFIHELELESIDLLPYHRAARAKYDKLEQPYPGEAIRPIRQEDIVRAVEIFRGGNIETITGG